MYCKICNTEIRHGELCVWCRVDEIRTYASGYQGKNGLKKYIQEMQGIAGRDELEEVLPALFLTGGDGTKIAGPN